MLLLLGAILILAGAVVFVIVRWLWRLETRPDRVIERWFKPRARRK